VTDLTTDAQLNRAANDQNTATDEGLTSLCARVEALAQDSIAGLTICNPARTYIERALFPQLPQFADAIRSIPLLPSDFGSCVQAVAHGEIITCSDIREEKRFDPQWRHLCLEHGIRSLQSRPVYLRDGKAYATFVLAYREPRAETNWNVALMKFAADAAGLIIQADLDRLDPPSNDAAPRHPAYSDPCQMTQRERTLVPQV